MKRIIGRLNPNNKNVYIWGAGFSGLVLGHYLKSQGYNITIFEKSQRVGGKIQTKKVKSGPVELGANALYMNVDTMDLLKELGLAPIPATRKLKRLLLLGNKPTSPLDLSFIVPALIKMRIKPPLVSDGLTVADFFKPLIGTKNINNILSPALGGIYATGAENLQFKSIFYDVSHITQFKSYWDFFRKLRKKKKSKARLEVTGSVSFEGGMQTLIDHLSKELAPFIKLNNLEKFKLKDNTIICTDALNASTLLKDYKPEVSAELARIKYQELSSVTVFLKSEIKSLKRAFGVLVPLNHGLNSIGVINNKDIFPTNYPNIHSYTFISRKKITIDEIKNDIAALADDFLSEDIIEVENTYWERALPIYDIHRYLSVKKLHLLMQDEMNLAIFGNYVAGISLREMVTAARRFATNPTEEVSIF